MSMARNRSLTRANSKKLFAQVKSFIRQIAIFTNFFIQRKRFLLGQIALHHAKIDQFQNVTDGAAMEALSMKIVLHLLQNVVSISFYVPILTFYYVMIITLSRELHIRLYDLVIDRHILDCNI